MKPSLSNTIVEFVKNNPTMTYRQIAQHFGIPAPTVYLWAKTAGVKKPKCSRWTNKQTDEKTTPVNHASRVTSYVFNGVEKDTLFEIISKIVNK